MVEELMTSYGRSVYGLCLKLAKTPFEADDLYQETFICAMRKKIRPDGNVKALLMKICINTYKSSMQKKVRRQNIAPTEPLGDNDFVSSKDNTEEEVEGKEIRQAVRNVVYELDDKYKIPILLCYTSELTCQEIADTLSLPEGTVKTRIHRGKNMIKTRLEAMGYE